MAAQPGEAGAVAAALLVGERSALSTETNDSLRISGLFHILSISGLHMMLIAGTTFFVVRALLALSPTLALRRPIRKWAALAALLVLTAYFALSGGGSATVRSYVMALIIFGAILVDRPAISMRNLAIAAFVVLALEPEGVIEPGFQMSFAAVAALIAAWEFWRERSCGALTDENVIPGYRILRMAGAAIFGVAVTTLIAGLATAPFAAYHFERVATYSLLGNLLAAPLVSAIIMPFGLLSLAVMPFGLEALPLAVMAWGIEMLLAVSRLRRLASGRAGARATDCRPCACSSSRPACCGFASGAAAGDSSDCPHRAGLLLIPLLIDPPDILVAPDGTAVAVRDAGGVLRVAGARAGSYIVEQFFDEEGGPPAEAAALREGVRCDASACLLHGRERRHRQPRARSARFRRGLRGRGSGRDAAHRPVGLRAPLVIDAPKLCALARMRCGSTGGGEGELPGHDRSLGDAAAVAGRANLLPPKGEGGHEVTGSGMRVSELPHTQDPSR